MPGVLGLAERFKKPTHDPEKNMIGTFRLIPLFACKVLSQLPSATDPPLEASEPPPSEEAE